MSTVQAQSLGAIEERTREDLASFYRLVAHFRMTDLIDTHISARIPGTDHFLINRYGLLFHEMRADNLIKIDLHGNVVDDVDPAKSRVNVAGFVIHSAIHEARHDLNCIIHTHTPDGIAVSCQAEGLLPISQHAMKYYGRLGYHDYEGVAVDLDERSRLVQSLGPHDAMILRNHGLIAAGKSIPRTFHNIMFLERACQAQTKALSGGRPLTYPSAAVCEHAARQYDREEVDEIVQLGWDAALRLL
ncbi:class II aldolase/adducin family protein [Variovorax sp. E3]|uniref:class II aldolase/adducin family protein n=1 Tax=Variovorax sp. E3 TaxID=1914993 RepID=UPI0018DDA4F6|nr:class II aldolase/adducin family protein [Variovorax sp. E3]